MRSNLIPGLKGRASPSPEIKMTLLPPKPIEQCCLAMAAISEEMSMVISRSIPWRPMSFLVRIPVPVPISRACLNRYLQESARILEKRRHATSFCIWACSSYCSAAFEKDALISALEGVEYPVKFIRKKWEMWCVDYLTMDIAQIEKSYDRLNLQLLDRNYYILITKYWKYPVGMDRTVYGLLTVIVPIFIQSQKPFQRSVTSGSQVIKALQELISVRHAKQSVLDLGTESSVGGLISIETFHIEFFKGPFHIVYYPAVEIINIAILISGQVCNQ